MTLKQYVNLVRNLAIKESPQKIIFYKQTQAKLSPTRMELCGGENMYHKSIFIL